MSEPDVGGPAGRGEAYLQFAVKSLILSLIFVAVMAVGLSVMLGTLTPDRTEVKRRVDRARENIIGELAKEKTRIRIKGLFTTNPYVHWKVSLISESEGNIAGAVEEMELAMGLLEIHSADKSVMQKYEARTRELQRRLAVAKAAPQEKAGSSNAPSQPPTQRR